MKDCEYFSKISLRLSYYRRLALIIRYDRKAFAEILQDFKRALEDFMTLEIRTLKDLKTNYQNMSRIT